MNDLMNRVKMFSFYPRRKYGKTDADPEYYCSNCRKNHPKKNKLQETRVIESRAYCEHCGWVSQ